MLDRLRDVFKTPPDDETVLLDNAVDRFHEEHEETMDAAREQAEQHRERVLEKVGDVRSALRDLEQYESDRTRVEDVTRNVARDRLKRIDQFDAPADVDEFHDAVDDLIQDIRAVTQKEDAVLNYVGDTVKTVFQRVDALEEEKTALEQFLEDQHTVIQAHSELEQLVTRLQQQRQDRNNLQEALADIDTAEYRKQLDAVEEDRNALDDDPEQEKKEQLESEIGRLEADRNMKQRNVKEAASKMERGLKKVLYQARNGDVDLSREHVQVLEDIKSGKVAQEFTTPAADISAVLDTAVDAVEQVDLGDRNRNKFQNGAETLKDLEDIWQEIERINEDIAEKQEELESLGIDERRAELERKRDRIQGKIQDRVKEKEQLRTRIKEKEQELRETQQGIEEVLDTHLYNDITIKRQDSR